MSGKLPPSEAEISFVVNGDGRAEVTAKGASPAMAVPFLYDSGNVSHGHDAKDLSERLLAVELKPNDAIDVNSAVVTLPEPIPAPLLLLLGKKQAVVCGDAEWAVGGQTARPLFRVLEVVAGIVVNEDDEEAIERPVVVTVVVGFAVGCREPQATSGCEDTLPHMGDIDKFVASTDTEDDKLKLPSRERVVEVGAGNWLVELSNDWGRFDDGEDCGGIWWLDKIDDAVTDASLAETNRTLASNNSHTRVYNTSRPLYSLRLCLKRFFVRNVNSSNKMIANVLKKKKKVKKYIFSSGKVPNYNSTRI